LYDGFDDVVRFSGAFGWEHSCLVKGCQDGHR
jgi:hypothetical protein